MKPDQNVLPEDYDQWEAEYFARTSTENVFGCLSMITIGFLGILLGIIYYIVS